ncbi:histone-lysine N-methyltransferase SETMAR [Trichonephila clavipes]|nr:histone-lysine N-methyltransferase SETMAR [Trichonephila clavipes]
MVQHIKRERPLLRNGFLLHHVNVGTHIARCVLYVSQQNKVEILPHPPYSPDLTRCNFRLFPQLKKPLRGKRFASNKACAKAACQVIYSQFGLAIHQNDHQARRRFVEWAQNEIAVVPDFHKRILFSDEAHFWLNDYVNKQNCRIWSEANPQVYVETPLHPEN